MAINFNQILAEKIASGLRRTTVQSCSRWAEMYRIMSRPAGPWGWKYHPWLYEMHNTKAEINVGQKAAQMGFTEWALNTTFYNIDVLGIDCLYILPTDGDASDFSAGRFDPALEASPHLKNLFSDVKNVGHKRAGQYNLYVRGSRSRSKLKSIPTGLIIFDEVDEMAKENIPLAVERASGQMIKTIIYISTPTLKSHGINVFFEDSTQEHYFFPCPHCNKLTELIFPDCLVVTAESVRDPNIVNSYLKCKECEHKLEHQAKFEWLDHKKCQFVPTFSDRTIRGFTVNQLYSATVKPHELAVSYLKSLRDPTEEQELYNSKLALPHAVQGSQLDDTTISECIKGYREGPGSGHVITMGVDVGRVIHYEIDAWYLSTNQTPGVDVNDEAQCRVLKAGTCYEFEDLDKLMYDYSVAACVVDRHPETRSAYQFATRFWGRILLCMYGRGLMGKQVQLGAETERTITVDRTSWLDLSLGRFLNKTIELPVNISEDYKRHLKEPVRIYERDSDGNPVGRYITRDGADDHFAHARNYSEIALPLAVSGGQNYNLTKVY